jgi:hypothetical protein
MNLEETGARNDYAGEDQQKFDRPADNRNYLTVRKV